MKKFTILSLFAAFLLVGISANAQQEQGDIRVRAGLAVGTQAGADDNGESQAGFGINFGAEYLITDNISIAPSYTIFFASDIGGADLKPSVFNIDGRYYFGESGVYGLAGVAFQTVKVEGGGASITGNATTFNIGAGIEYGLSDNLNLNGQLKYMGTDDQETFPDPQLVIGVGVSYKF